MTPKTSSLISSLSFFTACGISFICGYLVSAENFPSCKEQAKHEDLKLVGSTQYKDHVVCTYLYVPHYWMQIPLVDKKHSRKDKQWLEKILSRHTSNT